mmetsp:Transcript_12858/g.32585  ORF Transcript_12858/g.32585 Transcript_12858/m.32585 type:complete len:236 (+) Transcript_12858:915-1622(+)
MKLDSPSRKHQYPLYRRSVLPPLRFPEKRCLGISLYTFLSASPCLPYLARLRSCTRRSFSTFVFASVSLIPFGTTSVGVFSPSAESRARLEAGKELGRRAEEWLLMSATVSRASSESMPSSSSSASTSAAARPRLPRMVLATVERALPFSRLEACFMSVFFSRMSSNCFWDSSSSLRSSSSSSGSIASLASSSTSSSSSLFSISGSTKSAIFFPSTISGIISYAHLGTLRSYSFR